MKQCGAVCFSLAAEYLHLLTAHEVLRALLVSISVFKPKFAEPQRSRDEREDNSDFYSFGPNAANAGFRGKDQDREIYIVVCVKDQDREIYIVICGVLQLAICTFC